MADLDKIIKKIQALWAKACGTDIEAESLAFAKKAKDLLREYNLSEDILGKEQIKQETFFKSFKNWQKILASATARYFGCAVYFTTYRNGGAPRTLEAVFTGAQAASKTAFVMFEYFEKAILQLAKKHGYSGIQALNFIEAASLSLSAKLTRAADLDKEIIQSFKDATAFNEKDPALFTSARKSRFAADRASRDGNIAGRGISINLQVSNPNIGRVT